MSTTRGCPPRGPCLAGGISGSTMAHCSSVRSEGYFFRGRSFLNMATHSCVDRICANYLINLLFCQAMFPDSLLVLRELSRAEETLLEEFRRSANRLREQLHRFYPQMLQLCSAADAPWLWDLITLAPTPAHAMLLSEEQVQRVLKAHRLRRIKAPAVLACLQAPALPVAPGTAEAAQAHCGFLLPCLRVLAEEPQACGHQVG